MANRKKGISKDRLEVLSQSLGNLAKITQEESAMLTKDNVRHIVESFPEGDYMVAMNLISNSSYRSRYKQTRPSDGGIVSQSDRNEGYSAQDVLSQEESNQEELKQDE